VHQAIGLLPDADKARVMQCADGIRSLVAGYGDHGYMALALVGLENEQE
jgi:hypothetical protein